MHPDDVDVKGYVKINGVGTMKNPDFPLEMFRSVPID